jgi:transcriptional regulator with XRE-family HTH domain/antitoxin component HigA of HigAB toxin-antitoxin module
MTEKPTFNLVRTWINEKRGDWDLDGLDASGILSHYLPKQQPQIVASLLLGYLLQSGYETQPLEALAKQLAQTIGGWQEPERESPYHPLLVQSWLEGKQLIPRDAFAGILSHLSIDKEVLNESQEAAFELLRDAVEQPHIAKHPHRMDEATQTFKALFDASDIKQVDFAEKANIHYSAVRELFRGAMKLTFKNIKKLDEGFTHFGVSGLLDTLLRRNCEMQRNAFDEAESLGSMLRAMREHLLLSQEKMAKSINYSKNAYMGWESELVNPQTERTCCPTAETIPTLIEAAQAREQELVDLYGKTNYTPLLTDERCRSLTIAANEQRGNRNSAERIDTYTPELTAAIAVLRQLPRPEGAKPMSFREIAAKLNLHCENSAYEAHKRAYPKNRPLTDEERAMGEKELAFRGVDVSSLKTSLGAVHSGVELPSPDKGRQ